jgi:hypothetical protein
MSHKSREYKIIQGNSPEIERELNRRASEGWKPVTIAQASAADFVVIIERKTANKRSSAH